MATAVRRRRLLRAPSATPRQVLKRRLVQTATSPAARIVYVAIGAAGLAALSIAILGPRRFRQEVLQPVRKAARDQAEKAWSESRPLRQQIGKMFERVQSETGREKLARNLQSWIGHFRAT